MSKEPQVAKFIQFPNGAEVSYIIEDGIFRGLSEVNIAGKAMRSTERPILPDIRTPDGVVLRNPRLVEQKESDGSTRLSLAFDRHDDGNMEWMIHEIRPRVNTADWAKALRPAEDTSLAIDLKACERQLRNFRGVGFSYRFSFSSKSLPIYKILDRATWEPGGQAVGCEVFSRTGQTSRRKFTSPGDHWSTEWFLPEATNPNIFQLKPFQTGMEGFTFTAGADGVLITWAPQVAHIRTLIEKPYDGNVIAHWHEHCGDLLNDFDTSPIEVLWFEGPFTEADLGTLWTEMFDLVSDVLHEQVGMRRERITTYGQIEEWGLPDLRQYADKGVPKLLDAGIKTIGLANHFENNMNVYGISNMCCTVNLRVAESVGEDNLKYFCDKVKAGGAKAEMWGNTSLSTINAAFYDSDADSGNLKFPPYKGSAAEALKHEKGAFVRNPSGALEADHYTPRFACMNLRNDAVRKYWTDSWRHAHDYVGLEEIFLDSSFNLSSDKFHWDYNSQREKDGGGTIDQVHLLGIGRPAQEPPSNILSQYVAHLTLMADMQKMGYVYCGEDIGVFGIHRSGPAAYTRLDNMFMWPECILNFDVPALKEKAPDVAPDDLFFRGLAFRMMWKLHWSIKEDCLSFNLTDAPVRGDFDRPTDWHLALYKAFAQVEPLLHNLRVLADEKGVLYEKGGTQILWAFEDFDYSGPASATAEEMLTGESIPADQLKARRHQIYKISR